MKREFGLFDSVVFLKAAYPTDLYIIGCIAIIVTHEVRVAVQSQVLVNVTLFGNTVFVATTKLR